MDNECNKDTKAQAVPVEAATQNKLHGSSRLIAQGWLQAASDINLHWNPTLVDPE